MSNQTVTTLLSDPPTLPQLASTPPRARPSLLTAYPAALLLILLSFLLGLSASTTTSCTFDEVAHLAGGYIHYTLGQPRIHTENGYLSQAIAAFPLLFLHPNLPTNTEAFHQADIFTIGRDFLYHNDNNPAQLLLLGRGTIGLLTALTSLTIYAWSRKLFLPLAGILSLFIFAYSPLVLSHGYLATSDMPVTCFFLLSLASFWWALEKFSPLRITLSSLALGALFISKMSAPLILPALVILVAICILKPDPTQTCARKLLAGITLLLINALTVYTIIWATSGFTYSAFKDSPPAANETLWPTPGWQFVSAASSPAIHPILFARVHHLLPEAYLYGYAYVVSTTELARDAFEFAAGVASRDGHWWFYPYVMLITTPLPVFILALLALSNIARHRKLALFARSLYTVAPLLIFPIFYIAAAILSYRSSGPRHLLPVYPMLCILLGACVTLFRKSRLLPALALLSCLWLGAETLFVRPHFLSYFNELVGGPRNGYKQLVNSALDWGQDLPALATYVAANNPDHFPVYLAYFGSADPEYYGIHSIGLPGYLTRGFLNPNIDALPLQPGMYCISATLLQGTFIQYAGPYTPEFESEYQYMKRYLPSRAALLHDTSRPKTERDQIYLMPSTLRKVEFARLCAYLRAHHPPDAQAGYSINLYWLSANELDAALNGPPSYDPIK